MTESSEFVTNDGVRLVYERQGTATSTALVLIHGWSASRRYFDHNIAALSEVLTVYRLDLRFHGDSDKPTWGHFMCRLAADVHDLIQHLQLKSVVLLGTSMGCSIIWAYCMLYGTSGIEGAIFVDQSPLQNRRLDWTLGSNSCYDETTLNRLIENLKDQPAFVQAMTDDCLIKPVSRETAEVLSLAPVSVPVLCSWAVVKERKLESQC